MGLQSATRLTKECLAINAGDTVTINLDELGYRANSRDKLIGSKLQPAWPGYADNYKIQSAFMVAIWSKQLLKSRREPYEKGPAPFRTKFSEKGGMKLSLIEDDELIADFILRGLKEHGHVADHAANGRTGFLAAVRNMMPIIADRMLPGLDGLSIVKMLRSTGNHVPTLILTTMGGIDDRVEGLEAGADDYFVKPFAFVNC